VPADRVPLDHLLRGDVLVTRGSVIEKLRVDTKSDDGESDESEGGIDDGDHDDLDTVVK
jgi:hypothetical protein